MQSIVLKSSPCSCQVGCSAPYFLVYCTVTAARKWLVLMALPCSWNFPSSQCQYYFRRHQNMQSPGISRKRLVHMNDLGGFCAAINLLTSCTEWQNGLLTYVNHDCVEYAGNNYTPMFMCRMLLCLIKFHSSWLRAFYDRREELGCIRFHLDHYTWTCTLKIRHSHRYMKLKSQWSNLCWLRLARTRLIDSGFSRYIWTDQAVSGNISYA